MYKLIQIKNYKIAEYGQLLNEHKLQINRFVRELLLINKTLILIVLLWKTRNPIQIILNIKYAIRKQTLILNMTNKYKIIQRICLILLEMDQ